MEAIRRLVRKKKIKHTKEVEHQLQEQQQQQQQDHQQQQQQKEDREDEEEQEQSQQQPPQQSQQWSQQSRENGGPYNDDGLFDVLALDDFDYIRFTLSDMHGIGRCVSVPRRHVNHCLHQGLAFYAGTRIRFSPDSPKPDSPNPDSAKPDSANSVSANLE